jgi:hypothetical protein
MHDRALVYTASRTHSWCIYFLRGNNYVEVCRCLILKKEKVDIFKEKNLLRKIDKSYSSFWLLSASIFKLSVILLRREDFVGERSY